MSDISSSLTQSTAYLIKDILQSLLRQRRALDIHDRAQLVRQFLALRCGYGSLVLSLERLYHLGVLPKIDLSAYNDARHVRAVMVDLWEPFFFQVPERGGRSDIEAHKENVRLRVAQWAKTVVILLACPKSTHSSQKNQRVGRREQCGGRTSRIKKTEGIWIIAHHDIHCVAIKHLWSGSIDIWVRRRKRGSRQDLSLVAEQGPLRRMKAHRRDVSTRKFVGRVRDQQAGLKKMPIKEQ